MTPIEQLFLGGPDPTAPEPAAHSAIYPSTRRAELSAASRRSDRGMRMHRR